MKKILPLILFMLLFASVAFAQVIRPFAARYYNPSVKGNIVYVSNSIISSSGVGSGTPGTGEVPPSGASRDNDGNGINIDVDNPAPSPLYPFGSTWKYLDINNRPSNWQTVAFNDATWASNVGKFGYSASQATCIASGCLPICTPTVNCNKYRATYFRKVANINTSLYYAIRLNLKRDDGVVIYVNGIEVSRDNMPTGSVSHSTRAVLDIAPGAAENYTVDIPVASFVNGNNTIAVEIHMLLDKPADMSFDMEIGGLTDNGTFSSSTADLAIPTTCNQVLFAGLYWGADQGNDGTNSTWMTAGYNTVKLKIPGGAVYQTITSTQTDVHNGTVAPGLPHTGYLCFADITSFINTTNANGTYTVANVIGPVGIYNSCGGWTIVIVYGNASLQPRNLTVFDGSVIINQGDPAVDINISGFLTPPTGPVSCELGAVVYDGDRGSTDAFGFKQSGAASFYDLATTATVPNGAADAWNSKISYKGAVVTTRNPAFQNTLGYDAPIYDLPNASNAQLSNSQTAATVRFSSPSENYFVHVLTTSISQYNPSFVFDKTATDINGGSLVPGDSIRYQVNYNNVGNDSSTNSVIYDNIPLGSTFLPGSIKINAVGKTDALADDQAEYDFANNRVVLRLGLGANASTGGTLGSGQSGSIQFSVVTSSSCDLLFCSASLRNEARISYKGKLSGSVLYDSTGISTAGCIVKGPVVTPISGACFTPKDTLLVVRCPVTSITLPWSRYAGYTFYSAMPFTPANIYNQFTPVTASRVYWAYYNSGAGCSDTARIQVIITTCPDIDDDNDGIPDYVEFNDPLSLQDHNSNGIPNWNDPAYPGFIDINSDGYNDNFDWGADSDNNGIPNFQDTGFWLGWLDADGDGVNDKSDKDMDGIPNQYDLDSDNDGIPDVVESYGVDTNGDGIIDNYTETDYDGLSQNVDANNTGVANSGLGLDAPDFDGDGIANYLDTDSDNDGIPDIIEAAGADTDNSGMVDSFTDGNGDGITDNYILATALLKTGADLSPVDGRADSYSNKNKDRDFRPDAYDMDSDGDGIVDVIEAGFPDADYNGRVDGALGTNGWATVISSLPALGLRITDSDPYPDFLDIDSDADGIPDNIEAQTTASYKLPVATDTDGDGLVNTYDSYVGFGGSGIYVYDHDADGTPDYRDSDTDADGLADIVEGNDFNLNYEADDDVTPTGLDTDGDGLDNKFDSLNSVTNIKGTSYRMGNSGSFTGDAAPGSRTTVQRTMLTQPDRDWRFTGLVLPVKFLSFTGYLNNNKVLLSWTVIADKAVDRFEIERSITIGNYVKTATISQPVLLQVQQNFSATDDVTNVNSDVIYYRLKVIGKDGSIKYSNIAVVRKNVGKTEVSISPNPVNNYVSISFYSDKNAEAFIWIFDYSGKLILSTKQTVSRGFNSIQIENLKNYSNAVYQLKMQVAENIITKKLVIQN